MTAIFLTRAVGAKHLSDDDQDTLIGEIQDTVDANDGVLVLPEGWGVVVHDSGHPPEDYEDDGEDEEADDYEDEDEAMDGRAED